MMVSPEALPDLYLAYVKAPPSSSTSDTLRDSTQCAGDAAAAASAAASSSTDPIGVPFSCRECHTCGVPLKILRKYVVLRLEGAMTAHLCITTYKSPDNEVLKLELCFVGQDCQRIPSILGATYGLQTKRLDLSYNAIRSLDGLDKFPYLEELILDNNFIDDNVLVPRLDTLHTLSLNKNKLTNLELLLDQISERFPNLRYLSLLGNEACPNQLSCADKDEKDYKRYRLYVLHRLPTLKFLDSSGVRRSERREAKKRGALARTIRPSSSGSSPQTKMKTEDDNQLPNSEGNCRPRRSSGDNRTQNGSVGKQGSPEPNSPDTSTIHKGVYGMRRYKYMGQHSEGNRFINNDAL